MTTTGEYRGHPTITLDSESKYPFSFGLGKAKAILENLDAIKAFVADNEQKPAGEKA